eukprot:3420957-Amphidinium_carterae.1
MPDGLSKARRRCGQAIALRRALQGGHQELARTLAAKLSPETPTHLRDHLGKSTTINEVLDHFTEQLHSEETEDRKKRRSTWLQRMSAANIHYASGHIKPL